MEQVPLELLSIILFLTYTFFYAIAVQL